MAKLEKKVTTEGAMLEMQTQSAICGFKEAKPLIEIKEKGQFKLTDYIPSSDSPIKFICVNLHIFQNSNGTKNYHKSSVPGLKQVFAWINDHYSNIHISNLSPICSSRPVLSQQIDSRIRILLNRIEFYKDDALANRGYTDYLPLVNAMLQRDADMDSQLNIFLTAPDIPQGNGGYVSGFPSSNLNQKQYIHSYHKEPLHADYVNVDYYWTRHWAHELGHILGLYHLYDGWPCNENDPFYLYDVFGCSPNQVCPILSSNNNIMGGGDSWSFSTLQIATMQYNLQYLSVKQYAEKLCCPKCVAFGARIDRHKSQGAETILVYNTLLANESSAWDGKLFTCPVDGIYNFSLSFQKDSLVDGGTPNNVWVHIMEGVNIIGTIMSEKADLKSGWSPSAQQFGRRDSVSMTVNIKLKKGTIVKTLVKSENGEFRNIVDVVFSGHLICSECC